MKPKNTSVLNVVAAIIQNEDRFLIARRKPGRSLAGYWEFPGGKVEPQETPEEALVREIQEELNLTVLIKRKIGKSHTHQENRELILTGYLCSLSDGKLTLTDHDRIEWVTFEEMASYNLAPADIPLMEQIKNNRWPVRLKEILEKRNEGQLEEVLKDLMNLCLEEPEEALIHYHIATTLQDLGRENDSFMAFERSLQTPGLGDETRRKVLTGLAVSYRSKGRYVEAQELLEKGLRQYPNRKELEVFYAMVLHNLGQNKRSVEFLLSLIINQSQDPGIEEYKSVIEFYSDKLDDVWA